MSLALLLLGAALAGPADRALGLSDAVGTAQAADAAHKAARAGARLPRQPGRRPLPRAAAWTAVGRLEVLDAPVLDAARGALLAERNAPAVRARAAWALGELSRGRPWAEVQPVASLLMDAMRQPGLDAETAYAVVEAFGKAYPPHSHSFDEDLAATKALNTLAANQTTQVPPIYHVVLNRVLTLEVAVQLLRDEVAEARARPSPQALAEAHNAMLTTVRWMAARQDVLLARAGEDRARIEAAFDALLAALDLPDRRLVLLLTWSLGQVSTEPAFAALVGERVGRLRADDDPLVRMVSAWSLSRLRAALPAREALRATLLSDEADARVYALLALTQADPAELDVVQKLWAVEPRP
jgi:hypothetical protein